MRIPNSTAPKWTQCQHEEAFHAQNQPQLEIQSNIWQIHPWHQCLLKLNLLGRTQMDIFFTINLHLKNGIVNISAAHEKSAALQRAKDPKMLIAG